MLFAERLLLLRWLLLLGGRSVHARLLPQFFLAGELMTC